MASLAQDARPRAAGAAAMPYRPPVDGMLRHGGRAEVWKYSPLRERWWEITQIP